MAKGPGGQQEAQARVTVTAPPPAVTEAPPPSVTDEQLFAQNVQDAFFDYDSYALRGNDQQTLAAAARFLNQHPTWKVRVEGYCDERGSTEYNMALGVNRAEAAKQALMSGGANGNQLTTLSYGKEKPFCSESNEQCWQQNRRAHFVLVR
jgi:peptidoglycan-associated lipoprotein